VTAGGTREPIDPVRFVGNRSSGKQGHAIAAELAARGAEVILVTTSDIDLPVGAEMVRVETAAEMEAAITSREQNVDVIVMAAAVADFRPKLASGIKLKKAEGVPEIILEPTPDILAGLARRRRGDQTLVGFAAETARGDAAELRRFAEEKLASKRVDLIVANDVSAAGAGFAHDTNAVLVLTASGDSMEVPLTDKRRVAAAVVDAIVSHRGSSHQGRPFPNPEEPPK
jgi:phosphopantothenoylcysteine decarboxylase/phosphopantothenate--cysteine ligase